MPSLIFTPPASTSTSTSPTASHVSQISAGSKHTPVGAIVGGVVGGLLALVFILLLIFWLRRRKAKENLPSPFGLTPEGKPESPSRLFIRVSHGIILTEFWFLDGNTSPAQLEGQTVSGSNLSPLDSATVAPFQDESSRTPAHLGFSSFADRKRERNTKFSGATSGPSPVSSTARSDVVSSSATNLTSPASDVSSRISVSSPPAYEAIPDRSAFPSQ